ncbi:MAG: tyrosine--tRNA ligase [Planctomycetaceae bacterium]|nr:tyrosine--tRNA ligase [Planctomycetaceae bacterium]
MPDISVTDQLEVIRRGVEKIVPEEELRRKLEESIKTGRPLRIKYGIDPTAADVHLGHTVPLRKMRQFQELGHQAVIIIGNYTAMVGDPSGRDEARKKQLTADEVEANARYYLSQVGKVIDLEHAEVHRNGDWFARMNFTDLLRLCGRVTVAQLLTRDDFSKRMKAESPIYLHECLYPIMQAFDSVVIDADVELGGTEQLYSFMLARDLQAQQGLSQQIGMMSPILVGLDGIKRMGKSLGNYIGISEPPYEMMKKFMQLPDHVMRMFFELLTELPMNEVDALLAGHPKEAKLTLARTVISQYHAAGEAAAAGERWQSEIGGGGLPAEIPEVTLSRSVLQDGGLPAFRLLTELALCDSGGNARRLIVQGGAKLGEDKTNIDAHDQIIDVTDGLIVWAGKKKYCRVRLTD